MRLPIEFKGHVSEGNPLYKEVTQKPKAGLSIFVSQPGYFVRQYAATVKGSLDDFGFDPATDCDGAFTSCKAQVHNNCYNYAVDIATNSMANPGRAHGLVLSDNIDAAQVVLGAKLDGLLPMPGTRIDDLQEAAPDLPPGHFVALLIAFAETEKGFPGDFHWARCDDIDDSSWSQKDGPDQVTDFDFAGEPITDPSQANWTVNFGPLDDSNPVDFVATYIFQMYMFVPFGAVEIL